MRGVILFGPPASGKDTVTEALNSLDTRLELFRRIKVGPGRTTGYRMASIEELRALEAAGQIIYANHRYSSTYIIDRPELNRLMRESITPVIHLGQSTAVDILKRATPEIEWTTVELWCPRPVAAVRIETRGTDDTEERLTAWDQTGHLDSPDLRIDTAQTAPQDAAHLIAAATGMAWTMVVPTMHLTADDGSLDLDATRQYAEAAGRTWIDQFLVNGSTTRGDELTREERAAVLDVWLSVVSADRLLACTWGPDDIATAGDRGITPMAVMHGLDGADAGLRFLRQLPQGATVYSHPQFGSTLDVELVRLSQREDCLPAGGKLAKIQIGEIEAIHQAAPSFRLWDGSCRHIRESLESGADGIVATPLSGLLCGDLPPKDLDGIQRAVDDIQQNLDRLLDRAARRSFLLQQIRSTLAVRH